MVRRILLPLLLLCHMPISGCRSEQKPLPKGPECNYYWEQKRIHVCILGMPADECTFLFRARPNFSRDDDCLCLEDGRDTKETQSGGYRQLSCR